ncbi:hypothetical protein ACFUC1_11870 [Pedococcus sp. NPDC057267]|uniref:hypothetical protein n=1 Tax=Pedococcus sp. NPDC057267 TaxID=3346077 RepID=UPI00362D3983
MLWPFTTESAVLAWETAYRAGGHQPWHLSACETAAAFAQVVLHLSGPVVDRCEVHGDQAKVLVRQSAEPTVSPHDTTIRLLRIGTNPGGWTVVAAPAAK